MAAEHDHDYYGNRPNAATPQRRVVEAKPPANRRRSTRYVPRMASLLRIDASMDLAGSTTRRLTQAFTDAWVARFGDNSVVERDLAQAPLPYLTDHNVHFAAPLRPPGVVVDEADDQLVDELIGELEAADAVVLGVPLYNYSIPATLKTWIDYVHIAGRTAGVPTLPFAGRPAILCTARGASYASGEPSEGWDHASAALTVVLGDSMGMNVEAITTDLTLSARFGMGAEVVAIAEAQLAAALARAVELGATLPLPVLNPCGR